MMCNINSYHEILLDLTVWLFAISNGIQYVE